MSDDEIQSTHWEGCEDEHPRCKAIKGLPPIYDLFFGRFHLYAHDLIGRTAIGNNLWDWPFLGPIFEKYSSLDKIAVDVGANMGLHTVWLAKHNKRVYSIEPITHVILEANITLNGEHLRRKVKTSKEAAYDRNTVLKIAPEDKQGQELFGMDLNKITNLGGLALVSSMGSIEDNPISTIVLDEWILDDGPVGLIKVDAQGCDLRAMMGMTKTITRDHPAIVFEYEPEFSKLHGHGWHDYVEFFKSINYRVHPTENSNNWLALYAGKVSNDFLRLEQ